MQHRRFVHRIVALAEKPRIPPFARVRLDRQWVTKNRIMAVSASVVVSYPSASPEPRRATVDVSMYYRRKDVEAAVKAAHKELTDLLMAEVAVYATMEAKP